MEKVTIYDTVRPGRGERLPRVDFSESSRSNSPPLEGMPIDHAAAALNQTRRRSTRLLPNLRYLPPYDEHRPDEGRPADTIRPPRRQSCQASVYQDLAAQQDPIQSRRISVSRQGRNEAPAAKMDCKSSLSAAGPHTATSATALSRKVATSKALSRASNTKAMKPTPQKLQKQTVASLPRSKHKKTLAGGRQIKTYLRCEHLNIGPVWGGAQKGPQEQRHEDSLTKREAFERRRITRKIDALCAASAGATASKGDKGGKRVREEEEDNGEESPPAAKHNKLVASGRQYKTRLSCHHSPDQWRLQARPVTAVTGDGYAERYKTSRSSQGQLVSSDDGTSDDDYEQQKRFTGMGDKGSDRKKVVLKSNIKTPRRSFRNVYEEVDSRLMVPGAGTRSGSSSSYGAADINNYAVSQRESPCNNCDCPYCKEDTNHSLRPRCTVCADGGCTHTSLDDDGSAPLPDHRRTAATEPCPVCRRGSITMRDNGGRGFSRKYYQNACHFCGMVFGRSDLPAVSDEEGLQRGSCDHHYGSLQSGSRHDGDRGQRPGRAEQGGHLGGAATNQERTTWGTGLGNERPQTGLGSEETSCRDREERCSPAGGGRRSADAPLRDRAEGRRPLLSEPHTLRRGTGGRSSLNDYSGDETNNLTTKRARFEARNVVNSYKRTYPKTSSRGSGGGRSSSVQFKDYSGNDTNYMTSNRARFEASDIIGCYNRTYPEKSSSIDVGDGYTSAGPSGRRSSMGASILKNVKSTSRDIYSDDVLQNVDVNCPSSVAPCNQLSDGWRPPHGAGAREDNRLYSQRSLVNKQSRNVRSTPRKENLRPSLPRGAGKVVRVKRDPTHSLVLEDHL